MLKISVLNPRQIIYEGEAKSIFFPGDQGEFEVLMFHKPLISLLRKGAIIVDWKIKIPIHKGVVRVNNDQVVALVEE